MLMVKIIYTMKDTCILPLNQGLFQFSKNKRRKTSLLTESQVLTLTENHDNLRLVSEIKIKQREIE